MSLIFPANILDQHLVVLGKTGAGKSSALRHIVEYLLAHKKRVCIIDPKGDWCGLKIGADGKSAGFPVILFGDFKEPIPADVPLNEFSGKHIAELITSGNRPCVVGFRGWTQGNMHKFWIDFASTLFNSNEGELYLVIDEVHNFAPKGKIMSPEVGMCLHWANRIMNEGRGIGLVNLIASQRPQKVHNDTLTACETLVAMRVIHKADRDAIEDWIKGCGDDKQGKDVLASLAGMKRGEAFVWSPEVGFGPTRLTVPMFTTFDSFAPPQLQKKVSGKDWASVDLDEVKTKLATVIEKARATDPKELQKKVNDGLRVIRDLEKQLATKIPALPKAVETTKVVEKHVLKDGQLTRAEKILANVGSLTEKLSTIANELKTSLAKVSTNGHVSTAPLRRVVSVPAPPNIERETLQRVTREPQDDKPLPKGEREILAALIQYPDGLERSQIGILTGHVKRSTRDAYIYRLSTKGFVLAEQGQKVLATQEGIDALPDAEPLPTGLALQEYWLARLPGGEDEILRFLIENYPGTVSREAISEATGYNKRSTRDAYIYRLSQKQLVTSTSNGVTASKNLF